MSILPDSIVYHYKLADNQCKKSDGPHQHQIGRNTNGMDINGVDTWVREEDNIDPSAYIPLRTLDSKGKDDLKKHKVSFSGVSPLPSQSRERVNYPSFVIKLTDKEGDNSDGESDSEIVFIPSPVPARRRPVELYNRSTGNDERRIQNARQEILTSKPNESYGQFDDRDDDQLDASPALQRRPCRREGEAEGKTRTQSHHLKYNSQRDHYYAKDSIHPIQRVDEKMMIISPLRDAQFHSRTTSTFHASSSSVSFRSPQRKTSLQQPSSSAVAGSSSPATHSPWRRKETPSHHDDDHYVHVSLLRVGQKSQGRNMSILVSDDHRDHFRLSGCND